MEQKLPWVTSASWTITFTFANFCRWSRSTSMAWSWWWWRMEARFVRSRPSTWSVMIWWWWRRVWIRIGWTSTITTSITLFTISSGQWIGKMNKIKYFHLIYLSLSLLVILYNSSSRSNFSCFCFSNFSASAFLSRLSENLNIY